MSKTFLVNGVELICIDETKFDDVRKQFKENVTVDYLESWESKKEMEQYTATTFIEKARFYLSQSPPDLVQSSEKIWFAAVYAVKKLFLSSGGINLKSHKALNYFCRFALGRSELTVDRGIFLIDCWTKAEKMHQDVYGSGNFRTNEYPQIITTIETFFLFFFFVNEFANFDQQKLWDEFERTFILEYYKQKHQEEMKNPKLPKVTKPGEESKKSKGIKKNVVKNELTVDDFKRCLIDKTIVKTQYCIRSVKHQIFTQCQNKVALNNEYGDHKRYILKDSHSTMAFGNCYIKPEVL